MFNIGFVSLSVGTTVCVLNFHFRGHKLKKVPNWLKKVLLIKKYSRDGSFIGALCQADLCDFSKPTSCMDGAMSEESSNNEYTGEISEDLAIVNSYVNGKDGRNHVSEFKMSRKSPHPKPSPVKLIQMQKNVQVLQEASFMDGFGKHSSKTNSLSRS